MIIKKHNNGEYYICQRIGKVQGLGNPYRHTNKIFVDGKRLVWRVEVPIELQGKWIEVIVREDKNGV